MDAAKTAKFLANLQRSVGARRDPDDPPAPATRPEPAPVAQPAPVVRGEIRPRPRPAATPIETAALDGALEEEAESPVVVTGTARGPSARRGPRSRNGSGRGGEGANGGDRVSMEIRLDPGTGTRVVYIRVDKTLADRLQLIAFQNKISGGDGPTTINDIGIEALEGWLASREAQRAA